MMTSSSTRVDAGGYRVFDAPARLEARRQLVGTWGVPRAAAHSQRKLEHQVAAIVQRVVEAAIGDAVTAQTVISQGLVASGNIALPTDAAKLLEFTRIHLVATVIETIGAAKAATMVEELQRQLADRYTMPEGYAVARVTLRKRAEDSPPEPSSQPISSHVRGVGADRVAMFIELEPSTRVDIARALARTGMTIVTCDSCEDAERQLAKAGEPMCVIACDLDVPNVATALLSLLHLRRGTPVVAIARAPEIGTAMFALIGVASYEVLPRGSPPAVIVAAMLRLARLEK